MRGAGGGAGLAHNSPTPNTLEESSASQGGGDRNELQAGLGSRPAGSIGGEEGGGQGASHPLPPLSPGEVGPFTVFLRKDVRSILFPHKCPVPVCLPTWSHWRFSLSQRLRVQPLWLASSLRGAQRLPPTCPSPGQGTQLGKDQDWLSFISSSHSSLTWASEQNHL